MSQELEVLKILSELVIFLFSITIPTYAIAVSLLGPQYPRIIERIEAEKRNLENELREKAATGPVVLEELENKLKEFREKEKKLKSRFNPLSLYPTVVFPNIFFGASLLTILIGIYDFDVSNFSICLMISVVFIGIGLFFLGKALEGIQKAAKEGNSSRFGVEKTLE